jgi:HEAT repeat protein
LLKTLDDQSEIARAGAAQALGKIGGDSAVSGLAEALEDEEMNVRWRAVQSLGNIGGDRAVILLLGLLRDKKEKNLFVLTEAVKVLGKLGDRRAVPVLENILSNSGEFGESDKWFRVSTVAAVEELLGRPVRAKALSAIENKDIHALRESWADIIAQEARGDNFDNLLSKACNPDRQMQKGAWIILSRIDAPKLATGLLRALQHNEHCVRERGAKLIGYYRRDDLTCRELIRLVSDDPFASVKVAARTALEQINFARQLTDLPIYPMSGEFMDKSN